MLNPLSSMSRRVRHRLFYPLISLMVALSLVVTTPLPSTALSWWELIVPAIQTLQLSNMSDRQEVRLGQDINNELRQQVRLYRNAQINEYINEIGQRLVAESDRPNLPFTFQVVDDDSVNAFATVGGFVYVHTGLIKEAENEAELASVIGHEIGHITNKHVIKHMRQAVIQRGLASAAGLDRNTAIAIGVELALNRPRSRQFEYEADLEGFQTLGAAGYAQSAMISFFQKLLNQPSLPTFISEHPATSDRIEALEQLMNQGQVANGRNGLDQAAYRGNIRPLLSQSR